MWWHLASLLLVRFATAQYLYFPVPTTQIFQYARTNETHGPNDTSRLYFTTLSESGVTQQYNLANFPVEINNYRMSMLAEAPPNNTCPHLIAYHSVTTSRGQLKFERADSITPDMTDHGLAGYMSPQPGYCGSYSDELIEYYSPVLKTFRYDTSVNSHPYSTSFETLFRPVRVLGYGYTDMKRHFMMGPAPYNRTDIYNNGYWNTVPTRFDMVYTLVKGNKTSHVVSPLLIELLVETEGWTVVTTDVYIAGPVSSVNELDGIRARCGASSLQRCRDTYSLATGTYRPINLDVTGVPTGRIVVADCGYFFNDIQPMTCVMPSIPSYSYDTVNGTYFGRHANPNGHSSVGGASDRLFFYSFN